MNEIVCEKRRVLTEDLHEQNEAGDEGSTPVDDTGKNKSISHTNEAILLLFWQPLKEHRELTVFFQVFVGSRTYNFICYFFIIGNNVLITAEDNVIQQRDGELRIERQNDDGSLPCVRHFQGARSIQSILRTFPEIPHLYS